MSSAQRLAGLSIDVDSVASHLEGYGFERPEDDGAAYRIAIPRCLTLLEQAGARATFFLIVEEAARHREVVREIVERGHEVASHSMTHRLPFANLNETRMAIEIGESKTLLESTAGRKVVGFRAPSWDLSLDVLHALAGAGYDYDASTYPSLLLPLVRMAVARRSREGRVRTAPGLWRGVFGPSRVHRIPIDGRCLMEVPICTAPWVRLPYYHTLRFLMPSLAFGVIEALALRRRAPAAYQFHAVDFMGVKADRLDRRIGRHPGMRMPLQAKLDLAARAIDRLSRRRQVVPLAEVVQAVRDEGDGELPLTGK
jgi:hypothetical protein